jgi:hypothetical protein
MILVRTNHPCLRLRRHTIAGVHPVFHVFMLRKYIRDPELKIEADLIIIQQDLTIDAQLVHVLESSERVMCNRTIK